MLKSGMSVGAVGPNCTSAAGNRNNYWLQGNIIDANEMQEMEKENAIVFNSNKPLSLVKITKVFKDNFNKRDKVYNEIFKTVTCKREFESRMEVGIVIQWPTHLLQTSNGNRRTIDGVNSLSPNQDVSLKVLKKSLTILKKVGKHDKGAEKEKKGTISIAHGKIAAIDSIVNDFKGNKADLRALLESILAEGWIIVKLSAIESIKKFKSYLKLLDINKMI